MHYRLSYEFSYIGDDESAGFYNAFAGLPTNYYLSPFGSLWHQVTDFIHKPDSTSFDFGLSDDESVISEELSSIGFDNGISSKIEVFGALYQYTYGWLVTHENASINSIAVRITDVMCGKDLGIWQVNTENLQWCDNGECRLNITLSEFRPKTGCLLNTLIADNHRGWFPDDGFITGNDGITGLPLPNYLHPRYQYCDEIHPQFLQNFLWVFAQNIGLIFASIFGVISGIADLVGLDSLSDSIDNWGQSIFNAILGCGRLHPSPFVKVYFENACSKCGVQFESDIFKVESSPWYNTTHLFAPQDKGLANDSGKDWINNNKPNYTVAAYAFSLKDIFNAKYMHRNGVFYFNRKHSYSDVIVLDLTGADGSYILGYVCYNSNTKQKRPQAIKMEWGQDANDLAGNKAIHRYDGLKFWSTDYPRYSGIKRIEINDYSVARFTTDGIEEKLAFSGAGLGVSEENYWPDDQLLMEKDTTTLGKLIVWDGESSIEEAMAIGVTAIPGFYIGMGRTDWAGDYIAPFGIGAGEYKIFNYPMFFDWYTNEGVSPNGNLVTPENTHTNLYELHKIDDSTKNTLLNKSWSVTLDLCCYILDKLIDVDTNGDGVFAHLDYLVQVNATEKGTIDSVKLDYEKNEITINGTIKYNS